MRSLYDGVGERKSRRDADQEPLSSPYAKAVVGVFQIIKTDAYEKDVLAAWERCIFVDLKSAFGSIRDASDLLAC